MLQIKERKNKYFNFNKKRKTAFHGRGFLFDSKIYEKPMKLVNQIIQRYEKKHTIFPSQLEKRGGSNG